MKLEHFGLGAVASLATAGILAVAPAEAVTFATGDTLSIDFSVSVAGFGAFQFIDADGNAAPVGEYGNFGVLNPDTSGAFAPFETDGEIDEDYLILSSALDTLLLPGGITPNFEGTGNPPSVPSPPNDLLQTFAPTTDDPFLVLNDPGVDDTVEFRFNELTFVNVTDLGPDVNQQSFTVAGTGVFTNDNSVDATASFNGTLNTGSAQNSVSGTFVVEADQPQLPEPATLLGTAIALGLGRLSLRKRKSVES